MDFETKKYKLIEWITRIQDRKLIDKLEIIAEQSDWWDELPEAEKASIDRGLKDIEEGRTVDHSEAKKLYDKYL